MTIEATGLSIPEGPLGFVANRFVVAETSSGAAAVAVTKTRQAWLSGKWKGVSADVPALNAIAVEEIGFVRFLGGLRQNRSHAFYDTE